MMKKLSVITLLLCLCTGVCAQAKITPEPGGEYIIHDSCDNFDLVFEYSPDLKIGNLSTDNGFMRTNSAETSSEEFQYVTYRADAAKVTLSKGYMGDSDAVEVYVSEDNVEYTKAATSQKSKAELSGGWHKTVEESEPLPEQTHYVRLAIPKTGVAWRPVLLDVSINAKQSRRMTKAEFVRGDELKFSCNITTGSDDEECIMVMCIYDRDGKMSAIKAQNIIISSDVSYDISLPVGENAARASVYFMDAFDNSQRVFDTIEYRIR